MKESITQEYEYGCGIACFAFVSNISYRAAEKFLGSRQAQSPRFMCNHLVAELNRYGHKYIHKYVKPKIRRLIYQEGAIVLISRSKLYPTGHYLVRHGNQWMDPWINSPKSNDIQRAKSGFRKRLPGKPMYVFIPMVYLG